MSSLYHRSAGLPTAVRAEGVWVEDSDGRKYLDAASGALVSSLGHGSASVRAALTAQLGQLEYVHASAFTTPIAEEYAAALATILPMQSPSIYPVSGGSEAVETALKVARSYHLARGQESRSVFIGRRSSYHGNTLGALDVGDRHSLQAPYLPWLGRAGKVPAVNEYRCPNPEHPDRCAAWHAAALDSEVERIGAESVAAFVAEPIGGATGGATVPPEGYWQAVTEVCRRHGVLVIADEVMTGFGRTGAWFASEHFDLRPDIMTLAKGASAGYWPLGICAISTEVAATIDAGHGLVHGFTFSHHPVGAAVGLAVLEEIDRAGLIENARIQGRRLMQALESAIGAHPNVGDIRGLGLMIGVEIVADRDTKGAFPREQGVAERITLAAREIGLLVYPSGGCADGVNGDILMFGPPLAVNADEVEMIATLAARALGEEVW